MIASRGEAHSLARLKDRALFALPLDGQRKPFTGNCGLAIADCGLVRPFDWTTNSRFARGFRGEECFRSDYAGGYGPAPLEPFDNPQSAICNPQFLDRLSALEFAQDGLGVPIPLPLTQGFIVRLGGARGQSLLRRWGGFLRFARAFGHPASFSRGGVNRERIFRHRGFPAEMGRKSRSRMILLKWQRLCFL